MEEYILIDTFGWFDNEYNVDYVAIDTLGWFDVDDITISTSASDIADIYLNYSSLPNQYITKCMNSNYVGSVGNYNNERELFDLMVTEVYNKHGICMDYYVASFDKNYDKIWGEDNNRLFERRFQIMAYYQLPREDKLWSKFGMEDLDTFSVYVSKRHFWEASKYDYNQINSNAFSPYVPKIGDYLYAKYNKYIYEVVRVKDEAMMNLLSKQHVWELIVRPFKDEKIGTTANTSAAPISAFTDKTSDIFDIKSEIDTKKSDVNYLPNATEDSANDPFGGW